jgi:plastocyanin
MSKRAVLTLLALVLCTGAAYAGNITGKIQWKRPNGASQPGPTKDKIVVWLETEQETQPPAIPLTIEQKNLQFLPDFVIAVKGQKIDMPNDDDVAHNVYSYSQNSKFNLGLYPKGESRSLTFDRPGVVEIFCSIHRYMHVRVFVVPTPYFAVAGSAGTFTIANVPAGNYTLKVWTDRARMFSTQVSIPKTGTASSAVLLEAPGGTEK